MQTMSRVPTVQRSRGRVSLASFMIWLTLGLAFFLISPVSAQDVEMDMKGNIVDAQEEFYEEQESENEHHHPEEEQHYEEQHVTPECQCPEESTTLLIQQERHEEELHALRQECHTQRDQALKQAARQAHTEGIRKQADLTQLARELRQSLEETQQQLAALQDQQWTWVEQKAELTTQLRNAQEELDIKKKMVDNLKRQKNDYFMQVETGAQQQLQWKEQFKKSQIQVSILQSQLKAAQQECRGSLDNRGGSASSFLQSSFQQVYQWYQAWITACHQKLGL